MSILLSDLKFYAAATTPEDETTLNIGGAIDTSKKFDLTSAQDTYQAVSTDAGDNTQSVTVTYRGASALATVTFNLNGQTVVTDGTTLNKLEKAVKSATTTGDVAVEGQTAVRTGTLPAQSGLNDDEITLDAGASSVDQFYTGMIFRATGGTGQFEIVEIIAYTGSTKVAVVSRSVVGEFDNTTTFRISRGIFFDKTPSEIMTVERIWFDSSANAVGGGAKKVYVKGFWKQTDASGSGLTLTSASLIEATDALSKGAFGTDAAINSSTTNGAGNNRTVAPAGITFDSSTKAVPGSQLAPGDRIGVWMELSLAASEASHDSAYQVQLQGAT